MISIFNRLEQARNILRELRLNHPSATLPAGKYGAPNRPLDRACNFLEHELEGLMQDTGVDPSAGAATSHGAPDGKEGNQA